MPKRQTVKTVETDEIQGEGSFVKVTGVKVKEIKAMRRRSRETAVKQKKAEAARGAGEVVEEVEDFDDFGEGLQIIVDHVLDWNWVDDEGSPLPKPEANPKVFDELSTDEMTYLAELLTGGVEAKN